MEIGANKATLKLVAVMAGVVWAYHNGYLNFLPGCDVPSKAGQKKA